MTNLTAERLEGELAASNIPTMPTMLSRIREAREAMRGCGYSEHVWKREVVRIERDLSAALQLPLTPDDSTCTWTEDEDGNWETECGDMFAFIDGGPVANNCKYCPYCERQLREKRWEELDHDD